MIDETKMLLYDLTCAHIVTYSVYMNTAKEEHQKLVQNIETLRKRSGRTKKHLYDSAGISQNAYIDRMNNTIDFRFYEIVRIAEALDTTVSELTKP